MAARARGAVDLDDFIEPHAATRNRPLGKRRPPSKRRHCIEAAGYLSDTI